MEHLRKPPAGALFLLSLFLPQADRGAVIGDLLEEYQAHPSAWRLWLNVLGSLQYFVWIGMKRAPGRTVMAMLAGYVVAVVGVLLPFAAFRVFSVASHENINAMLAIQMITAFFAATAGAYCTARIARGSGIHGIVALWIFTLLMGLLSVASEPILRELALMTMFSLGIMLGSYLRARQVAV